MKLCRLALVALVLAATPALAEAPRESTIRELLAVSKAQKLVEAGTPKDKVYDKIMEGAEEKPGP